MESFFAEHWEVVVSIFGGLVMALTWFLKQKLSKVDAIEKNYLQRFDDIKADSARKFEVLREVNQQNHLEILAAINATNINIAGMSVRIQAQTEKCSFIQDSKMGR